MFSKFWMSLKASRLFRSPAPRVDQDGAALRSRRNVMRQLFVTLPMVVVAAKLSSGFSVLASPKSGNKPKTGSKPKTGTNPSPKTPSSKHKTQSKTKTGQHNHHHGRHCGKTKTKTGQHNHHNGRHCGKTPKPKK